MRFSQVCFAVIIGLCVAAGAASAGEAVDINSLKYGMRYCAAPGSNNKEFIDTHFGIDAKTGKMTKYVGGNHPYAEEVPSGEEVVLYVAPPISVENRYVGPDQAFAMRPPPANSRVPMAPTVQQPQQRRQAPAAPQYTGGNSAVVQPQSQAAAPRVDSPRVQKNVKKPWWKAFSR